MTPNNLKFVEWVLAATRQLPLNDYEKMSVLLLMSSYARAHGMIQRDMVRAIQQGSSPSEFSGLDYSAALKQLVTPDRFPHLHPLVMSGAYTGEREADNTVGDDFDFGLERILDGIEQIVSSKRSQTDGT